MKVSNVVELQCGYTQIKTAQEGKIHSTNYLQGTYTLKKKKKRNK